MSPLEQKKGSAVFEVDGIMHGSSNVIQVGPLPNQPATGGTAYRASLPRNLFSVSDQWLDEHFGSYVRVRIETKIEVRPTPEGL